MSPLSLEKNIRTCKVNTGWASRNFSDRFQDSNLMVCPTWNHMDSAGRLVCANSFYTKRAGCNSPLDRVAVENSVSRPQYVEYIQLNSAGIKGPLMTNPVGVPTGTSVNGVQMENYNSAAVNSQIGTDDHYENYQYTGSWNGNTMSTTIGSCPQRAYAEGMAQIAAEQRQNTMVQHAVNSASMQGNAGMA
jgi:hypothetical protein